MGVLDKKKILVARFYSEEEKLERTVIYENVSEKEIEKEVDLIVRDYEDYSISDHAGFICIKCNNADEFHCDTTSSGSAVVDSNCDFVDWIEDGTSDPVFNEEYTTCALCNNRVKKVEELI